MMVNFHLYLTVLLFTFSEAFLGFGGVDKLEEALEIAHAKLVVDGFYDEKKLAVILGKVLKYCEKNGLNRRSDDIIGIVDELTSMADGLVAVTTMRATLLVAILSGKFYLGECREAAEKLD
ncbi:uncharacterized protein LOC141856841 [Brevipalpus obovatus]|uniref:uncharacterized protein LOC141856841 n=1 Tax=Brevipalpus obovatus TaxID=246614 RepID=UPI003D9E8099